MKRLAHWLHRNLLPAKTRQIPFSELREGNTFWFRGECYVKENDGAVFKDEPTRRPFHRSQIVEVLVREANNS